MTASTGMFIWRISGPALPDRRVTARSFDEAIHKARELYSPHYTRGQIVEDLDEPDFVGGAPNYDKFAGWEPERVLAWLNVD